MISEAQAQQLLAGIGSELQADVYGEYTVCNLYLDTERYDLIRTSLAKPIYKEKLRLRSYGIPKKKERVFLELKKKYKHVVYKRRVKLCADEAERYLTEGVLPPIDTQIFREIDWAMQMYRPTPKLFLAYDRQAFSGKEDPTLRLTFDRRIRFRTERLRLSEGDDGEELLPSDRVLLEIKCSGAMPLWLSRRLSELAVYPTSFSKYGRSFERLCARGELDITAGIRAVSTLDIE